jgi:spermidine/putrescine transport system ATP-binding protein
MQIAVPAVIEAAHLTRRFSEVFALDDVTLAIMRGEFFSLLGPSGCGKTTFLRIIAGLDFPDAGSLHLACQDAKNVPAHRRAVNTVFQSYALFPHLNVRSNIAFGLRMKKVPRAEMETRVRGVMELTRIAELAERMPSQLSGGQKQRVALARALVNEPEVLLLDEPMGALDLKLRKELQMELRALQRRTGITFIYVTHDQDEALSMSDRIAVMNEGRIVQLGTSEELYERPRTCFVAEFLGGCNLLCTTIERRNANELFVRSPIGELRVASHGPCAALGESRTNCTLAIRPEKIAFDGPPGPNTFTGEIIETAYSGAETHCVVRIGEKSLRVVSMNAGAAPRPVRERYVSLTLPPEALLVLED